MSYIQQFFTSRDNNANAETFVGQEGRLWWDPATNQIYSSDGNTPGGIPLSGGGGGNGTPGGSNSQVQFNQAGNFGGSANLTFNSTTGTLTAVSIVGNGAGLTNITGSNVVGEVAYAAVANSVAGANVSGTVANATYAVSAGSATSATTAGTVTTNAQPNITSVGTLISVSSTGNISTTGNITGNYYIGNGSLLTSLTGSNVTGTVANATYALSANSATSLINGSSVVLLNSDGTMVFPSNAINTGANAATLWSTSSSSLLWRSPTGGGPGSNVQTIVRADNGNATISVATGTLLIQNIKSWVFDTAGNVVFPDTAVQTTAYPGTATALSLTGNITGGNVIGTTGVSVGGTGGDLTMTGGAITGVGNITSNGIMAINAPGGITTTQTSFDIVNATATTVNLGGSATAVNIGAITGTVTINNPTIVGTQTTLSLFNTVATTANVLGAASNIIMGATSGTLTLRNPTIVGTQATQSLFNTVATTVNFAGAATALNIGNGATASGSTKTISIGENGAANSVTNINIGTAAGNGNVSFSANTLVRIANTSGTALSVAGNITGGNLISTGAVYSNYNTNTANTGSFMAQGGNTKGGTGYLDFLVAQNTSGGATNPYKWFRTTSDGQLQIINSAYTTNIFNLSDAGAFSVPGPISVSGKQAVNGPAFSAYASAVLQTITSGSQQKVLFQTEEFDTNSNYANSRFTPTVEGYYQLNAEVRLDGATGTGEMMIVIWKNGSGYKRGTNQQGTQIAANFWAMQVSSVVYANGTTDYFEIYVQQGSGGNVTVTAVNDPSITWFNGCMLRGA